MYKKKFTAILLALIMLLSALPAWAAEDDAASRQAAIYEFVTAVGESSFSEEPADLSAYSDGGAVEERYSSAVALAVSNGLIRGYEDNTLRPENTITRLEALIVLGRCLPEAEAVREAIDFTDVPDWAAAEIDRLYCAGLVNGYGNGLLGANDNITFAQLALLTERVRELAPEEEPGLKDDFYSAVNRDYLASAVITNGIYTSPLSEISGLVGDRLNEISLDLVAELESQGYKGSLSNQAAKLYTMALESDRASDMELGKLKVLLRRIQGTTTLEDMAVLSGEFIRDYRSPILFDVSRPYISAPNVVRAPFGTYVDYVGTGYERSFWEKTPGARESYTAYIRRIMELLKDEIIEFPVTDELIQKAADTQIKIDMAGKSLIEMVRESKSAYIDEDAGDDTDRYFLMKDLEIRKNFRPLTMTIKEISKELNDPKSGYFINDINQMDKIMEILTELDADTLRTICTINLVEQFMSFMPRPYREASAEFRASVTGSTVATSTPEDYATSLASMVYTEAYEKKYLEKYGDIDVDSIDTLVQEVLNCFKDKFRSSSAVSPSTAVKALDKLEKMTYSIAEAGYDYDENQDYYILYKDMPLAELGMTLYGRWGGTIYSIYTSVNSPLPCYTVNASYQLYENSFQVYAGLLNPPMYGEGMSEEEILATVGHTIAHEISHAFDETGSQYDSSGRYSRWWQGSDYNRYSRSAQTLAEVYSGHTTAQGNSINAELTADENIADIMAMDCIITIAKERGLDLDVLFRAYAESWAELRSPQYDKYSTDFEVHSDGKTRVNAVLSNFDEFYEVYGITEGDGMYVPPEKRVKFM